MPMESWHQYCIHCKALCCDFTWAQSGSDLLAAQRRRLELTEELREAREDGEGEIWGGILVRCRHPGVLQAVQIRVFQVCKSLATRFEIWHDQSSSASHSSEPYRVRKNILEIIRSTNTIIRSGDRWWLWEIGNEHCLIALHWRRWI